MSKKAGFYAVAVGRQTGIFHSWTECEKQVKGYPKPVYKKFKTKPEADEFLSSNFSSPSCLKVAPKADTSEYYKLGTKDKVTVVDSQRICWLLFFFLFRLLIPETRCTSCEIRRLLARR